MSDAPPATTTTAARGRRMIVNGALVDFERATTHLMSPAMRYGLNIFEGIRAYWNEDDAELYVFRLHEHMERFAQSMRLLRFAPEFDVAEVTAAILELLRSEAHRTHCAIRTTAYLDGIGEHHVTGPVSWFVYAAPRPRDPKTDSGIHAHVSSWRRISDNALPPRIKCGANYANARLARYQARTDGYDDAIMLNEAGKVGEGPGACLFLVRAGRLITPDVTSGILESITRDTILGLARERGLGVEERAVDRTELYTAEEAFFAGSAAEVLPIVSVDRIALGAGETGPITTALRDGYFGAVEGRSHLERGWLTAVHGT